GPPPFRGGSRGDRRARARGRRQVVASRARAPHPPTPLACAPVPARSEPRELREAAFAFQRGGLRRGPLDPRAPRAGGGTPLEVRLGPSVPRAERRAVARVRPRRERGRDPRGAGRVHLKSGGRRVGIPSRIESSWLHDGPRLGGAPSRETKVWRTRSTG